MRWGWETQNSVSAVTNVLNRTKALVTGELRCLNDVTKYCISLSHSSSQVCLCLSLHVASFSSDPKMYFPCSGREGSCLPMTHAQRGRPFPAFPVCHTASLFGRNMTGLAWDNAWLHCVNRAGLAGLDGVDCVSTSVASPVGILRDLERPSL